MSRLWICPRAARWPSQLGLLSVQPLALSPNRSFPTHSHFKDPEQYKTREWADTPEYPELLDPTPLGYKRRKRDKFIRELQEAPTVHEKQVNIHNQKYFGAYHFVLKDVYEPYSGMDFIQAATRTQFIRGLPTDSYYTDDTFLRALDGQPRTGPPIRDVIIRDVDSKLRSLIAMEHQKVESMLNLRRFEKDRLIGKAVSKRLAQVLYARCFSEWPHLQDSEMTLDNRIEYAWLRGDFFLYQQIKNRIEKYLESLKKSQERDLKDARLYLYSPDFFYPSPDDKMSFRLQVLSQSRVMFRHAHPLPLVVPADSPMVYATEKIPEWSYNPKTLGYPHETRFATSIPGVWPEDPRLFCSLAFFDRSFVPFAEDHQMTDPGVYDVQEALDQRGIRLGFALTGGQAAVNGFDTYNDVTYPFVSQLALCNGPRISFYLYQLNTNKLHDEFATAEGNPKTNLCWGSQEMELYSTPGGPLNHEAMSLLVKAMLKAPEAREGLETYQPYVGGPPKPMKLGQGSQEEKTQYMVEAYRYYYSNRPRVVIRPEIWDWEKFFVLDNLVMVTYPRAWKWWQQRYPGADNPPIEKYLKKPVPWKLPIIK
ncbi:unnamed protein product [Cyprideis torosa]|uniref:Uncharacterized protein n=1 Tax=Cyprideis torosa TaxID=163714 RepID=A0A7R8W3C7_9CRUS|nr:unnamed protein product [Cyprideis torosa]CAG0882901.1 unnamed protein product [Cyprideis torosa]